MKALVYGDVDMNLIDGSAVWAQGMVRALAAAGCEVTFVLKAPVRTGRLIDPLEDLPGVTLRRPHDEELARGPMGVSTAAGVLAAIDDAGSHDLVVIRGRKLAVRLAESPFAGRLWTYLTDVPQSVAELDDRAIGDLTRIARASRVLLCQTEELRGFLEGVAPATCGKCVLFPPVVDVPAELAGVSPGFADREGRPLRLAYSGKFAPRWNTYEMTGLPHVLAERGFEAELHMIGDKVHRDPTDPGYQARMKKALESAPGVVWHGGHPRAEALRLVAACDVGLSWRAPDLDASLELSTKVLEMGALGVPVVLNRTPMHERLFGTDYPLFADGEAVGALIAATQEKTYELARRRCREAAAEFTLDKAADRLRRYLARAFPTPLGSPKSPASGGRLRIGVAGHDLKFLTRLMDQWRATSDVEVRVDQWHALGKHDPERSAELASWADVILCEWCGPNAVWYGDWMKKNRRPGQRLLVRLHRFELYGGWPARVPIREVDQVICVSPHYARLTRDKTGWPERKITVIPNWVDADQLGRPKLTGVRHHLGMIGIAPSRKRLDLALDVLAELRREDPRYTLFVKSKLPWEYAWVWGRPEERAYFERVFRRIRRSPSLAGSVVFDPYGPDVAAWLRRIGHVLSVSDDESFHLAPAEGMASGAVPALLGWPGAETIYDPRWIHPTPLALAQSIAEGDWAADRETARTQLRTTYALDHVATQWSALLRTGRQSPG